MHYLRRLPWPSLQDQLVEHLQKLNGQVGLKFFFRWTVLTYLHYRFSIQYEDGSGCTGTVSGTSLWLTERLSHS